MRWLDDALKLAETRVSGQSKAHEWRSVSGDATGLGHLTINEIHYELGEIHVSPGSRQCRADTPCCFTLRFGGITQMRIRSTSSRLIASLVRSYSLVARPAAGKRARVRGDSSAAICCACLPVNPLKEPLNEPLADKQRSATAVLLITGY